MKSSFTVAILVVSACLSGCIANPTGVGMKATGFTESRGLGLVPGYSSKQKSKNEWAVNAYGNGHTSPSRIFLIAKVRAAQIAVENGYTYMKFTGDISVSCQKMNGALNNVSPHVAGMLHATNQPGPGYEAAQDVLNQNLATVRSEPDSSERGTAFEQLRASCYG